MTLDNLTTNMTLDIMTNETSFCNFSQYHENYGRGFVHFGVLHRNYILMIFFWAVFFLALPGICFAIYRLLSQMKSDEIVPVYVINILISDLIQISTNSISMTMAVYHYKTCLPLVMHNTYLFAVLVNVFFVMCIFVERYMMIVRPVWYKTFHVIRTKVCASIAVWILSSVIAASFFFNTEVWNWSHVSLLVTPYIPMFCLFVGTWRALSQSSVPRNDQRRIKAILGLILFMYTTCFGPALLEFLSYDGLTHIGQSFYFNANFSFRFLVALNPLFDLLLYVLIRTDGTDFFSTFFRRVLQRHRGNADITNVVANQV